MRCIHNLALVGFMGTGKSSVGRLAAEALRFDFIDTDNLIETKAGMAIEEIFKTQGEPAFRLMEQEAVRELEQRRNAVISAGGGVVSNAENLASLKSHSLVICLWASPEVIWERVKEQTHRPLLKTEDPLGRIRELLARRDAHYRQADVLIQTDHRSAREVTQQVLLQFQAARR